jgi:hypothetical protein
LNLAATAPAIETPDATPREIANRANAQLSTGPRTEAGKGKSSLNAVRSALTGRTVLLPEDDVIAYELLIIRFRKEYNPTGEREGELVQRLAAKEDPAVRSHLIDNHTLNTHARQLNNLSIQESRLRRNFKSDLAELEQLQADRSELEKAKEEIKRTEVAKTNEAYAAPAKAAAASALAATDLDGFVFSSEILDAFHSVLHVAEPAERAAKLIGSALKPAA